MQRADVTGNLVAAALVHAQLSSSVRGVSKKQPALRVEQGVEVMAVELGIDCGVLWLVGGRGLPW